MLKFIKVKNVESCKEKMVHRIFKSYNLLKKDYENNFYGDCYFSHIENEFILWISKK